MNQTSSDPADQTRGGTAPDAAAQPRIRLARPHRIALIQSSHHRDVVEAFREAFVAEVGHHGIAATNVGVFVVPGAYEIPLHAQLLARTGRFTAIVASALVIDSGDWRHANVANTVVDALMRVQLQTETPIFSAVLTPLHDAAAGLDLDLYRRNYALKGVEVAQACLQTLSSLDFLGSQVVAGLE